MPKRLPPPPLPTKPSVAPPKRQAPPLIATRTHRTFTPIDWTGKGEGLRIVVYGPSGGGKTTLASLLQEHVDGRVILIGLDDGGRKIRNPKTGAPLMHVPGVETFEDVRDALQQPDLFMAGDVCVIDTVTKLESVSEDYVLRTVKTEKGARVESIEGYGYGKGYKHLLDSLRLVLTDLDALVRRGVHVLLLAQEQSATIANAEGLDFLQDGPKLWHSKQYSSRLEIVEWADHVFRVAYHGTTIVPEVTGGKQAPRKGKIKGDSQRAIYTTGAPHFAAKCKPPIVDPVVSFESPEDDTIWDLLFTEDEDV
jgi:hypothetical protein